MPGGAELVDKLVPLVPSGQTELAEPAQQQLAASSSLGAVEGVLAAWPAEVDSGLLDEVFRELLLGPHSR